MFGRSHLCRQNIALRRLALWRSGGFGWQILLQLSALALEVEKRHTRMQIASRAKQSGTGILWTD